MPIVDSICYREQSWKPPPETDITMSPRAAAMAGQSAVLTVSPSLKQDTPIGDAAPEKRAIAVPRTAAVALQSDSTLSWDPAPETTPQTTVPGTAASQLANALLITAA